MSSTPSRPNHPLEDNTQDSQDGRSNDVTTLCEEANKNPHFDPDLPRVSSQIDLTGQDVRNPTAPEWSAGSSPASPDWSTGNSGRHLPDDVSISSVQSSGSSQQSIMETNTVVTSSNHVKQQHPLGTPEDTNEDDVVMETGSAYVEPEVIVMEGESESDEDCLNNNDIREIINSDPLNVVLNTIENNPSELCHGNQSTSPCSLGTELNNSNSSSSSCSSLGGALSTAKIVLPEGTNPLQAPDGVSPGLPQRRSIKLKRPKVKSK